MGVLDPVRLVGLVPGRLQHLAERVLRHGGEHHGGGRQGAEAQRRLGEKIAAGGDDTAWRWRSRSFAIGNTPGEAGGRAAPGDGEAGLAAINAFLLVGFALNWRIAV